MPLETLFIDSKAITIQYSEDEKKRMVIAYQESGMKMKDWCIANSVSHHALKNWSYRLGLSRPQSKKACVPTEPTNKMKWTNLQVEQRPTPAKLSLSEPALTTLSTGIRIDFGTIQIHVSPETPPALLKMVLSEVTGR